MTPNSFPAPPLESGASQMFMRKAGPRWRLLRSVTDVVTGSVTDNPLKSRHCYGVTDVTPYIGLHVRARAHTYINSVTSVTL